MKLITVYGAGACSDKFHCEFICEILRSAEEAGYSFEYIDFLEKESQINKNSDGYVFIYVDVPNGVDKPHIRVLPNDTQEETENKMQLLADYLDNVKKFEPETNKDNCPFFGEDIYKTKEVPIGSLGFDLDYNEVIKIPFDFITINVDGKDISLSKENIITLGKVCNMINFFGYKVTKVIV